MSAISAAVSGGSSFGICGSTAPVSRCDEQAAGAVAGADDRAIASAVERVGVGRERQAALALVLAVTLEAVIRQQRPDLRLEVDEWAALFAARTAGRVVCVAAARATTPTAAAAHKPAASRRNFTPFPKASARLKECFPWERREYTSAAHLGLN